MRNDREAHESTLGFGRRAGNGALPSRSASLDSPRLVLDESLLEREGITHEREPNRLLAALPFEDYERLMLQCTRVELRLRDVLIAPRVPIPHVYFLQSGVASVIVEGVEGAGIEAAAVGFEGFVGLPVLLGATSTTNRVFVQVAGHGWRLPAEAFRAFVDATPALRHVLLRYSQYYIDEVSQSVACNARHNLEQRCARWLLMTNDRVHGSAFDLTHDFLALMLGVHRPAASLAMGAHQRAGLIHYSRGHIEVLDRKRLEETACSCYRITRAALEQLLG